MHPLVIKIFKPTRSTSANVLLVSLAVLVLLIASTLFFLSNIVRVTANNWLAQRGFVSSIEIVEINILDSQVEIGNTRATNSEGRGFNIGKAYLDFSWAALQDRHFLITGIELADISITIRKNNDDLYISGIPLTGDTPKDEPIKAESPEEIIEEIKLPWKVSLEDLKLSNINICYQQTTDDLKNTGDGLVVVHDVCFNLGVLNWEGEVDYSLTADQTKHPFHINGDISLQDLKLTNNYFDNNSLSYDRIILGEVVIKLHDEPNPDMPTLLPMRADSLVLSGIDSCFQQSKSGKRTNPLDGYCFLLDKFNWVGASGYSPASSLAEKSLLHVDGTMALEAITLVNKNLKRRALSIGELRFDEIFISSFDDINIRELSIHKLSALQKDSANNENVISFEKFSITPINIKNQNHVSVGKVLLDGLQVSYEKLKNGEMEHVQWLPQASDKPDKSTRKSPEKTNTGPKESFNYSINSIDITNSKSISFIDHTLAEEFMATVSEINMSVQQLDSSKPSQMTQHSLNAKIYDYGSIETSGTISPLTPDLTFDVRGKIRGLDLRKFNPYVKSAISHIIESGQLDSDFVLKAQKGQLDSNVDLTLHHFELEALSDEAAAELNDTFGLPLNPSLALIRERDGSINIDVDIKGDAENPDFNPVEIVTKAISTSIAKAVVVFYTPYGLIVGADALFDLATALKFDPVIFDAGSAELNTANIGEFSNLSKLLTERPQVHIRLCGFTNNDDAIALFDIKSVKDKPIILSDGQLDQLVELARKRATTTKRYLVDKQNIAADRVILCTHKRTSKDGSEISGVEITI